MVRIDAAESKIIRLLVHAPSTHNAEFPTMHLESFHWGIPSCNVYFFHAPSCNAAFFLVSKFKLREAWCHVITSDQTKLPPKPTEDIISMCLSK